MTSIRNRMDALLEELEEGRDPSRSMKIAAAADKARGRDFAAKEAERAKRKAEAGQIAQARSSGQPDPQVSSGGKAYHLAQRMQAKGKTLPSWLPHPPEPPKQSLLAKLKARLSGS